MNILEKAEDLAKRTGKEVVELWDEFEAFVEGKKAIDETKAAEAPTEAPGASEAPAAGTGAEAPGEAASEAETGGAAA